MIELFIMMNDIIDGESFSILGDNAYAIVLFCLVT